MDDASKKIPVPQEPAENKEAAAPETKNLLQEKKDVWERARQAAEINSRVETRKDRLPTQQENDIIRELRKEIEGMELEPRLKKEAEKKAKKIEFLGEKEKLEHLIRLTNEKGIEFAVKVAKNMGDPYVLDLFHDLLIKEGYYRNFLSQVAQSATQTAPANPSPPANQAVQPSAQTAQDDTATPPPAVRPGGYPEPKQ